jgi:hypothetical protein
VSGEAIQHTPKWCEAEIVKQYSGDFAVRAMFAGEPSCKWKTIDGAKRWPQARKGARATLLALVIEHNDRLALKEAELKSRRSDVFGFIAVLKDQETASRSRVKFHSPKECK